MAKDAVQGTLFQRPQSVSTLRVGPAGWNYRDWEGVVYPPGSSCDPLAYLADYCDTIEINSSFYAPPRSKDTASWARRVANNPRFRFTAKAWQRLTHERSASEESSLIAECDEVRASMAPLMEAERLGALLIQFPWKFRYTPENQDYLEKLFGHLSDFPVVVEVRHASWDVDSFYEFLRGHGVAFCNVDQPLIGKSIRPGERVTAPLGYFRLHGRNYKTWFKEDVGRDARYDYLYTKPEIRRLAGKIRTVRENAKESYAITNNHFRGQAVVNALELLQELEGTPPAVPPLLEAAYPDRFPA
ncbi:MAG: DUF72 domain-containing protein [Acidobacteria bacterium]|nr:DUF72 domain-containing protein [Acidobacteriota bacterium]